MFNINFNTKNNVNKYHITKKIRFYHLRYITKLNIYNKIIYHF